VASRESDEERPGWLLVERVSVCRHLASYGAALVAPGPLKQHIDQEIHPKNAKRKKYSEGHRFLARTHAVLPPLETESEEEGLKSPEESVRKSLREAASGERRLASESGCDPLLAVTGLLGILVLLAMGKPFKRPVISNVVSKASSFVLSKRVAVSDEAVEYRHLSERAPAFGVQRLIGWFANLPDQQLFGRYLSNYRPAPVGSFGNSIDNIKTCLLLGDPCGVLPSFPANNTSAESCTLRPECPTPIP